jgi:cellulose synthase/poly-beta-1,6-N-acetylglucosamine synthase-like glycosyltransferase
MESEIIIVIPTFGNNPLLPRTLDSISQCKLPHSFVKTIVIENGPKGNVEEICKEYHSINCEYKYSEVANKSSALNIALKDLSNNSFLIFFDDDIRVSRNVIISYYESFLKNGDNYFYGGPFEVDYEKEPPSWYRNFLPPSARGWKMRFDKISPYDFLGFNWGVHIKQIRKVGNFDSQFGPNSTTGATGQERDMMLRLDNAGVKPCFVADALVWHYVPKDRSTFNWALMRWYKGGINEGINGMKQDGFRYRNTSVLNREVVNTSLKIAKAGIMLKRTKFVSGVFNFYRLRGIRKGLKLYSTMIP